MCEHLMVELKLRLKRIERNIFTRSIFVCHYSLRAHFHDTFFFKRKFKFFSFSFRYFLLSKKKKRGVYFACILFHEDKVLVTTEEFPPVVEVDDTYPASVNNDFHWLMKVFHLYILMHLTYLSNF